MSKAEELAERAQMFEKRAERAMERSSRQHYREMAAHYRALSIEHREIADLQKPLQAEFRFGSITPPSSLRDADRSTYRRVVAVGAVLCVAFVAISFSLRPQPNDDRVLVKADRLVRTAGEPARAR